MPLNGLETSSPQDISLQATLTNGALPKSDPMICAGTGNVISSPALQGGRLRLGSRDGATAIPSGPEAVHVSRFRSRATDEAMPTSDTSGPLFTASSPSASLQSFLESRLRARMAVNGSPLYALIWSMWDMPSGP